MTKVRAKVTSKGQVTIPKAIREALELEEGSEIEFHVTDEGISVQRARSFLDLYGSVTPRNRPEDWKRVREETMRAVGRSVAREGLEDSESDERI